MNSFCMPKLACRSSAIQLALLIFFSAKSQVDGAAKEPDQKIVGITHRDSWESFGHHAEKPTLDSLKRSVFRITVYKRLFRWSRPFDDHFVVGSLGSGFLINLDPIVVCTCAHVVNGADFVYLQVTEFGKTRFPAKVKTINNHVDVALVTLESPKELLDKLADAKVTLQPLRFAGKTPPLGHNVVAPGFPLGQETLTLSTGVISGVDHVSFHYTNLAIQSTAIISQGNSGSPLLDGETLEVIGMNYAKKTYEAQINYVVALWRLKQVFTKHNLVHSQKNGPKEPFQFKLVEHGLVTTPGVHALYMMAQGNQACKNGPLISTVLPTSPFRDAKPAILGNSFLVSLDGVKLDKYGQGAKKEYVDELVDFIDLMWMRGGTGEEELKFETCNAETGQTQLHKMSMEWRREREGQGIQFHYNPRLDKVEWEIYGDLIFMDLTENHIKIFGGDFHSAAMIRFLEPTSRQKPRLAVMLLKGGGEAQDALDLIKGRDLEIVESINGHSIGNLDDFRKHFFPKASPKPSSKSPSGLKFLRREHQAIRTGEDREWAMKEKVGSQASVNEEHHTGTNETLVWTLKTVMGKEFATLFVPTLASQAKSYLQGKPYVMTSAAKKAMLDLGWFSGSKKKSLLATPHRDEANELDIDPALQLYGDPLEEVGRVHNTAIVDLIPEMSNDRW